jgi:hypothetical protein
MKKLRLAEYPRNIVGSREIAWDKIAPWLNGFVNLTGQA